MSDNEDLLGDDLGDHSLADYNLGNDEEDQLLADDYEGGSTQNVPTSIESFREPSDMVPSDYSGHGMEFGPQPIPYQPVAETECVVPNIVVEVPNVPAMPPHSTYAPYEPRHYESEHAVPPAMPAAPIESPQIVPSEIAASIPSDMSRERFISERPVGAQRMPQVRDIPDSLDKVVIAGGFPGVAARGRTSWRNPQFNARFPHPYRRNNMHRGNFSQRNSFPPQRNLPNLPPHMSMRPELPHDRPNLPLQPQIRVEIPPERMDTRPMDQPMRPMDQQMRPMDQQMRPMDQPPFRPMERPMGPMNQPMRPMDQPMRSMDQQMRPMDQPMRPMDQQMRPMDQPMRMDHPRPFPPFQRFPYREERPFMRPQFDPMYPRFQPRFQRFPRDMGLGIQGIPQVTIQNVPDKKEPEVRMLPVLPPTLPGLAGKKVLINPHFKGNFQPVDGLGLPTLAALPTRGPTLPTYVPTRIQKSPPLSPTLETKFGPIKDIDDAAERFIAEQRNALARAAGRKREFARRSPQRYIENTTIEIENELASRPARRRSDDDDLLRRQEEFIHANRAGLRRRMRSPSPTPTPRRSVSPRRSPERRHRPNDEDNEYKRRVREQETLRERVLRAKEVRRRKNAALYIKQQQEKEKDEKEKEQPQKDAPKELPKPTTDKPTDKSTDKTTDKPAEAIDKAKEEETKPDTTRKTPERDWTPELDSTKDKPEETKEIKDDEVNSTCEDLTPPPRAAPRTETPPLPTSDDELDLILGDIDGILSDDEDIIKKRDEKPKKPDPPKPKPVTDLRSKLPPKPAADKKPRQKIIFKEEREENKKKKDKSPPRRAVVTSSTKAEDTDLTDRKSKKQKQELSSNKSRQRIIFENKESAKQPEKEEKKTEKPSFSNRRVILQRKPKETKSVFSRIEISNDPTKPTAGIFSRAVRTAIGSDRIVVKNEPEIEYGSDSDDEDINDDKNTANVALVTNLPHGMTDTRLKTLAGDVQTLLLDKEDRSAKITFKTSTAADTFKKKFNNKMVAASRLTVTLQ